MKKIFLILITVATFTISAENIDSSSAIANTNAKYISRGNYLQNPYGALPSKGGTQKISDSELANQNFAEHVFADGTWNILAGSGAQYMGTDSFKGGFPSFGYGADLFGQTGSVAGFSVGGLLSVANPFYSKYINGDISGQNQNGAEFNFLPANRQIAISETYLEYQYSNIVQADLGFIGINNSPWLTYNYYNNILTPGANYRGLLVNVYPGSGWLLTALAFNGSQFVGNTGFTHGTFYNTGVDHSSGTIISTTHELSNGTVALGANFIGWNNQYNLRLWDYQFQNYGNLLYADNTIKFQPTELLSFNLGAQGVIDTQLADRNNAITNDNLGTIASNLIGLQSGFAIDFFSLNLAYSNIWGPVSAYGKGAIVSPYTYGFATDPLYTTPYLSGLVELGVSGQVYKISPAFTFLNGNLSIAPALTTFITQNPNWSNTHEYDFVFKYSIPQVQGLTLFAVYAYQQVPAANPNGSTDIAQLFISYLY